MAKKKQIKKHKFKHVEAILDAPATVEASSVKPTSQVPAGFLAGTYGYVIRDMRHIGILAVGLVLLELVLWYVFGNTPLGTHIYRLIAV